MGRPGRRPKFGLYRKDIQVAIKSLNNKPRRVYADSSRPSVDDRFPFTERYFHKAFSEQGLTADGLSLWEVEEACVLYWEGLRRESQLGDIYEVNEFDRDFVHDDDLSHDLKRTSTYDPEWGDGDARWSFSLVRTEQ